MMRNVAIGAVLGFGVMVLVLSVFGVQAPPQAPAPIAVTTAPAPPPDAAVVPTLVPLKIAPINPRVRQFERANAGEAMAVMPMPQQMTRVDVDAGR